MGGGQPMDILNIMTWCGIVLIVLGFVMLAFSRIFRQYCYHCGSNKVKCMASDKGIERWHCDNCESTFYKDFSSNNKENEDGGK